MAAFANMFEGAVDQAFQGNINWSSDTIKMALLTPAASPDLAGWAHYSDVVGEVAAGSGYGTGGVTLTSKTHVVTPASSWGLVWAAGRVQGVGDIVAPVASNGFVYGCVVAGTTGGSSSVLDSGPMVQGQTVVDGSVTWTCLGRSLTVWSSDAAVWSSATFSALYGVIYDAQTGVGSSEPLIALANFGSTLLPVNGLLTVTPDVSGWFVTTPA